jgi:hypothetical protein
MIWQHQASELYIKWASQLGFIYKISCAFGHPDIVPFILILPISFTDSRHRLSCPTMLPLITCCHLQINMVDFRSTEARVNVAESDFISQVTLISSSY